MNKSNLLYIVSIKDLEGTITKYDVQGSNIQFYSGYPFVKVTTNDGEVIMTSADNFYAVSYISPEVENNE